MITVHHLENSRSQRVLWLLEELGLPYEIHRYERDASTMMAPPALRRVHPLGKAPMIEDAGIVIAESGAIVEYLVEKAGGALGPAETGNQALKYRFFLHYAEGSVMPLLLVKLVLSRIPILGKLAMRKFQPMMDVHLAFIEAELAGRPWFAGSSLSAADMMMSFPIEAARHRAGLDAVHYPHTMAWLEKIQARPAYQRALHAGGTYAYA